LQARPEGGGTRIAAETEDRQPAYSALEFVVTPEFRNPGSEVTVRPVHSDVTFDQEEDGPAARRQAVPIQASAGRESDGGGAVAMAEFVLSTPTAAGRSISRWPPALEKECARRLLAAGFLITRSSPRWRRRAAGLLSPPQEAQLENS